MKTNKSPYISLLLLFLILAACSTKKNKWANRNFQALNTKYNVLYYGNIALTDGVNDLKAQYRDNFWEILPVERMQVSKDQMLPGETKNANFERAEEKATKAIQKRSMHIDGSEKNSQIDEAYLLLGKSRYYDTRFVPALEAFNYILYKNPDSDKINEAKIWREKTNMRLDNDAVALGNLNRLLSEIKVKDQVFADANATITQAYLNLGEKTKAIKSLKIANEFTKSNEEKARYNYILGQLYDALGKKDSAFAAYQTVIDMKRKSPRVYIVHAHGEQAKYFDYKKGDTVAFKKKYTAMFKDIENKPYLDVLNYQLGMYYDRKNSDAAAKMYYNRSLRAKPQDRMLIASNYKNIAKIYFDNAKYVLAGKYYDSTLVNLEPRTREYNSIKRKRINLDDVIKYEGIAQTNDSILNVLAMSDPDRQQYYETYISKLKKEDEAKAALKKAADDKAKAAMSNGSGSSMPSGMNPPQPPAQTFSSSQASSFYFYTPATVAYGKLEFEKKWGKRQHTENWRLSEAAGNADFNNQTDDSAKDAVAADDSAKGKPKETKEEYTTEFYTKKLPTDKAEIATLEKDRNFAYYQLGLIYKEKFTEYQLAANKLEKLLTYNPEDRLVLPTMYHLYKIYDIIDKDKALAMKNRIIQEFPDSRYASILSNNGSGTKLLMDTPEVAYSNLYEAYEQGEYFRVLEESSVAIDQFLGEEIVPKFELLKANTIGKLKGVDEYKNALNFVALNYPNSYEGKEAEAIVQKNVPLMQAMNFSKKESKNWNILFPVADIKSAKTKTLEEKVKKFTSTRTVEKLSYSVDIYTMTEHFIVIHGIPSEEKAVDILSILTDYKDYRIIEPAVIISSENYAVVQIKKNLDEYRKFAKPAVSPVDPAKVNPVQPTDPAKPTQPKVIPGTHGTAPTQQLKAVPLKVTQPTAPAVPANTNNPNQGVPASVAMPGSSLPPKPKNTEGNNPPVPVTGPTTPVSPGTNSNQNSQPPAGSVPATNTQPQNGSAPEKSKESNSAPAPIEPSPILPPTTAPAKK